MALLKKINPEWVLRLSLGAMYVYSGFDLFVHPKSWTNFIPFWLKSAVAPLLTTASFVKIQGVGELLFALVLIIPFLPRRWVTMVATLSALEMAGILLLFGVDLITFRDIGLLGAAVSLVVLSSRQ
ncbi:MAG: hypothetical protein HY220_04070 [Candidatus Sungbacteria bacterium]|uniref:DoxX family protein n=1 Tax=Candidatus Sungiibacteriota bacterium TaxID=2750080 RepID=A0A9D6LP24_9BACT|nr:hypothetical protein [Candidatus Sungbacteria bacterium]